MEFFTTRNQPHIDQLEVWKIEMFVIWNHRIKTQECLGGGGGGGEVG